MSKLDSQSKEALESVLQHIADCDICHRLFTEICNHTALHSSETSKENKNCQ